MSSAECPQGEAHMKQLRKVLVLSIKKDAQPVSATPGPKLGSGILRERTCKGPVNRV